jgi:hypothetical protein
MFTTVQHAQGAPYATCKAYPLWNSKAKKYDGLYCTTDLGDRTGVYECSGKWEFYWTKVICPNETAPHPILKGCRTAVCGPDA